MGGSEVWDSWATTSTNIKAPINITASKYFLSIIETNTSITFAIFYAFHSRNGHKVIWFWLRTALLEAKLSSRAGMDLEMNIEGVAGS